MKRLLIIITTIFLLYSCTDSVFSDYYNFNSLSWDKEETPVFNFEISEKANYDIVFALRYIEGFSYKNMNASLLLVDENKTPALKKFSFPVVNDDNEYIGDVAGNLWDIEYVVFKDTILSPGKYSVKVEQLTDSKVLPFVYDVGIQIIKKKK